ncbi:hypothetical protein E4U09_002670 [Claviceps aff. purpurea]|uniref:Uncharacterized protein n=1 Tax=Claviceps aff. purpurea TaxID=1967640 RepID=A0A9P7QHI0_9HYPO|nr:hypothetical protein E4U09_002670 [Claviceps aff. purpurea]
MADHSVNGTGSGMNGHSQPRNNIGRDSPPDSTARGLDRLPGPLQLRLSAVRRIFVGNTELRIAMAPPQSAEVTTTPQVVEVTLGEFRRFLERRAEVTTTPQNVQVTLGEFRRVQRFLERRQEQAALHQADASDADEVATVRRRVGPVPRLCILCSFEQWWQLQADFPRERLWDVTE